MKQFTIENEEKQRILEMHKYATQKNYLNVISESEKGLITEVTTLTTDELKGLDQMAQSSIDKKKLDFMFTKPDGKNQFSIRPLVVGAKTLTYELIPPQSMPSVELVTVGYKGCFTVRVKKGELPSLVSNMFALQKLLGDENVMVLRKGTKIAEKPIFGTFSFDNKAHGYENDDDTVLQLFTCASYDNLMKFMNMLRSNKWLSAQSKIPGGVTVGIRLV